MVFGDMAAIRRKILAEIGLQFPTTLVLPQLRGAWLFSSVNASGNLIDTSGHGKTLTNVSTVAFDVDEYLPYGILNGSSQYFTRADEAHFDITGALTLISIAYFDNTASALEIIAGKLTAQSNQRSYALARTSGGKIQGRISGDGTTEITISSTVTIASGDLVFCALRYTPSTALDVYTGFQGGVGGGLEKATNITSIPASLKNSSADFSLGVRNVSAGTKVAFLTGRVSITMLCAAALSDDTINQVYTQLRQLYDV